MPVELLKSYIRKHSQLTDEELSKILQLPIDTIKFYRALNDLRLPHGIKTKIRYCMHYDEELRYENSYYPRYYDTRDIDGFQHIDYWREQEFDDMNIVEDW